MSWEKANLMFPEGHTIYGNEDISINQLDIYDNISYPCFYYARNMITKIEQITFTSDNQIKKEILYDINNMNNKPTDLSCLSVYGNRMVQDYYNYDEYKTRRYNGEVQRAGFNYTGL